MVHLILTPAKGNSVRYWPHTGYLGLTPVKIEGFVATKRDPDQKLLPSKSVTVSVRCYESRIGRLGILQSNVLVDYTEVLWTKPDDQEYEEIGDLELPFRISLPAQVGGFSTSAFVEWRVVWRVEAVLYHAPIIGVGQRQIKATEIALTRYDVPSPLPSLPPHGHKSEPLLSLQTNKPRAPRINYSITTPASAVGPMDLISVPISLQPLDSNIVIRSASIVVERRIQLSRVVSSTPSLSPNPLSPSPDPVSPSTPHLLDTDSTNNASASTSSLTSSNPTITPNTYYASSTSLTSDNRPLLSQNPQSPPIEVLPTKTVAHTITEVDSSGPFSRTDTGIWNKTLTVQWPTPKSNSRWAIGETIRSDLVSVRFFLRAKVLVATALGTETIELQERELLIISTNESERKLALAKYNDIASSENSRSKSKSPRRTSRRPDDDPPELPTATNSSHSHKISSASSQYPSTSFRARSIPRRPHTSAGPRDKVHSFGKASSSQQFRKQEEVSGDQHEEEQLTFRRWKSARAEPSGSDTSKSVLGSIFAPRVAARPSDSSSNSNMSESLSTSSISDSSQESDDVREWEAELAQIEVRSRRSSDMLGFTSKKKRSSADPRLGKYN